MNSTAAGSSDRRADARFLVAGIHQAQTRAGGGFECLCGAVLGKHRDVTEHIIDAYQNTLDGWAKLNCTAAGSGDVPMCLSTPLETGASLGHGCYLDDGHDGRHLCICGAKWSDGFAGAKP